MPPSVPVIAASCQNFEHHHSGALDQAVKVLSAIYPEVTKHPKVDTRFPDGEAYAELPEFAKGTPVFLFQALVDNTKNGPDASIVALLVAARAYKEFGAGQVTAIVPYLAYARQDRMIPEERRPTTSRLVADLFASAGVDQVIAIRSGSSSNLLRQFGHPPLQQVSFVRYLERCARQYDPLKTVLVAPDAGALLDVQNTAEATGHKFVSAQKLRMGPESVELRLDFNSGHDNVNHALILDDLVSSAGTVEAVFEELRQFGIRSFSIAVPHCRLTQTGRDRLQRYADRGELLSFHATDTIPVNWHPDFVKITPFMAAFSAEIQNQLSYGAN